MSLKATLVMFILCFLFLPNPTLTADVVPGHWEKVDAQRSGTQLTVVLKHGEQIDCVLKEVESDALVVQTYSAQAKIPKSDVARVEAAKDRGRESSLLFQHASQPQRKDKTGKRAAPTGPFASSYGENIEPPVFTKIKHVVPHPDHQFLIHNRLWKDDPDIPPVGDKSKEQEARLLLGDHQLEIYEIQTRVSLRTIQYSIIDFAEYSKSRHLRAGIQVHPDFEQVFAKLNFFERKHWLILHLQLEGDSGLISHAVEQLAEQSECVHFAVLQLDKNNFNSTIRLLERKAGIKVLRVPRKEKLWPWQSVWQRMKQWPQKRIIPRQTHLPTGPGSPAPVVSPYNLGLSSIWQTYGQGLYNNPDQKRNAEQLRPDRWRDGVILDPLDVALGRAREEYLEKTERTNQKIHPTELYNFSEFARTSEEELCLACLSGLNLPSDKLFHRLERLKYQPQEDQVLGEKQKDKNLGN